MLCVIAVMRYLLMLSRVTGYHCYEILVIAAVCYCCCDVLVTAVMRYRLPLL